MPKSITVNEPATLLAFLFATWPDEKKKQIRTWLRYQAVSVNGRPVTRRAPYIWVRELSNGTSKRGCRILEQR